MTEDIEQPQDAIEQIVEIPAPEVEQDVEQVLAQEEAKESQTKVPLSALQKERRKRQELELELQWEKQNNQKHSVQSPPPEDTSKYESATREDLSKAQEEAMRAFEEKMWIKQNPEKYEKINEQLPTFLKQRPNLASAINAAGNRYEEAFTLMEALTPKQQQTLTKAATPKKEAPGAPTSVPKVTAMNQAVDVMTMSDSEFSAWRKSQKKR